MGQHEESSFPKMGESPLESGHLVNISGDRSRYTMPVAKKGPSSDSERENPGHRGATSMSGEHNGPRFKPATTICYPNAPEHSATGRGMRTLPAATSGNFWSARQSDNAGEVISE